MGDGRSLPNHIDEPEAEPASPSEDSRLPRLIIRTQHLKKAVKDIPVIIHKEHTQRRARSPTIAPRAVDLPKPRIIDHTRVIASRAHDLSDARSVSRYSHLAGGWGVSDAGACSGVWAVAT
ncbi:MAG: hypothetical protein ACLP8S_30530 [Solirubrobacteraceae bacterium]